MAYVIAEPCINTKDTACVNVCPVDCIHPKKDAALYGSVQQLYINPDECIDCGACVPECPVAAIFPESDLKAEWKPFAAKNRDWFVLSAADFQAKYGSAGKS
ncbi:MAG: ferredoxin family protein [Anaerolineales bacterium]|nr:ferredoxin family protein [Anaerolineales bacterium]